MGGVLLTETNARIAESVEQDPSACMCRTILLFTCRKIIPWSQTSGYRSMLHFPLDSCCRTGFTERHCYIFLWTAVIEQVLQNVDVTFSVGQLS